MRSTIVALLMLIVAGCASLPIRVKYGSDQLDDTEAEHGRQITMMLERIAETQKQIATLRVASSELGDGKTRLEQLDKRLPLVHQRKKHIGAMSEFINHLEYRERQLNDEINKLRRIMAGPY